MRSIPLSFVFAGLLLCSIGSAPVVGQVGAYHVALQATGGDTSSPGLARIIDLDLRNVPLVDALEEIGRKADLPLVYSRAMLPTDRRVTLQARRITAGTALTRLLERTTLELRSMPSGQIVIIPTRTVERAQPTELAMRLASVPDLRRSALPIDPISNAEATVRGQVTDASTNGPISGAQVAVVGTQHGTLTRPDGTFSMSPVPEGTHRIRVTMFGYGPQERTISLAAGQSTTANFQLEPRAVRLDEIVAVGYGTQRRRDVTGAVASIRGEDIITRAAPTSTISSALQGRAPGVQVITNSGMPGGGASVRVRGTNSIGANSEPLYVVDGIPVTQGTSSTDPTQNPLNTINPNDIASIDILKDASATAIYGARGANGVILITTERGQRGTDQFSLESSYGIQEIAKSIQVLNAQQYRELRNEALVNVGESPIYQDFNVPSYDYPNLLLRTAPQQSHTLTFSGGDERTRYLISGNFMDQDGIVLGTEFSRYAGRLNLDREFSARFRMGTSLSLARTLHNLSQVETGGIGGSNSRGLQAAMMYDPALAPRDEDGNWIRRAVDTRQISNPLATVSELIDRRNDLRFTGNLFGELDIAEGMRLRTSVGANIGSAFNPFYAPSSIEQGFTSGGEARIQQSRGNEILNENLLTYRREAVGPGALDVIGGFTIQRNESESTNMVGQGFLVEQPMWRAMGSGETRPSISSSESQWTLLSYLGRANYDLLDRYTLTVTGRYDGSSRFGEANKWAFFPSAAVAWRMSEESFMEGQRLFDDLKLRFSYGVTGNQGVSPYQSLARLGTVSTSMAGSAVVAFAPGSAAPNPNLRWETTRQFNAGVDMDVLEQRVNVSVDAYHSRTEDLLLEVNMPFTSGFSTQLQNIGAVQNRGVELGINTINIETPRFGWRSTLSLATNRNEVVAIDARDYIETGADRWGSAAGGNSHLIMPGQPLGTFYGYLVEGLYQQGDPCPLAAPRPTEDCVPGELRIVDMNEDGRITPDDRTIIGHADPRFYGGLNNRFNYGAFSLDAFVNFSYGGDILNASNAQLLSVTGQMNERAEVLNRWTPENTGASIPRANANRRTVIHSDLIEDGSFLRLQTLTLGYDVPQRLLPGTAGTRLYLTGQNLLTLTGYSGFDPEVNSLGGHPAARGLDVGAYPRARTWNVGVNVTF
jgi:TonB-dependent starch-binding outer membrane protein SusC